MSYEKSPELVELLSNLEIFLGDRIDAEASIFDEDSAALLRVFRELNTSILSKIWFSSLTYSEPRAFVSSLVLERIAESSGALAFLSAQFMGACRYFSLSPNKEILTSLPHDISHGHMTVGVGTTQLKPGPSTVNADRISGGFVVEGQVPWVSGLDLFTHFLVAARVGESGTLLALVPFSHVDSKTEGKLSFSSPFSLHSMKSTNTVAVTFQQFFVADGDVISFTPSEIPSTKRSLPLYVFPLGCARAALRLAKPGTNQYGNAKISESIDSLLYELDQCSDYCRDIFYLNDHAEIYERSLNARTWIDLLLMRAIFAALPLVGGRCNILHNKMGRLYREASIYSTSLQNEAIIERKLMGLVSRP